MCGLHTLWNISEESFRVLIGRGLPASRSCAVTDEERQMKMLGDGLVAAPVRSLMRAMQIDAPSTEVWPWLSQMMRGAGVYGWLALETADCQSADYLLDGLQEPQVGDRIGDVFQLVRVNPLQELVWKSVADLSTLGFPMAFLMLDYLLQPVSQGQCRVVVRASGDCDYLTSQITRYLFQVIDSVLSASQLATMKNYVETYPQRLKTGDINRGRVKRHQSAEFHPAANGAEPEPLRDAAS